LHNLSQTHPAISFLPNGSIMVSSRNTGLFVAAGLNVNFTFDPAKNELDIGSVSTFSQWNYNWDMDTNYGNKCFY
jgi:hypothetical protein